MNGRIKDAAAVYIRRSDGRQESSFDTQLEWATNKAREIGLLCNANSAGLKRLIREGGHQSGNLFVDNAISGAQINRPGLNALIAEVESNKSISHLLVFKRDRLGRPEDPIEMMALENRISKAGVTIVFSDGQVDPSRRGSTDVVQQIGSLLGYHQSGKFLEDLSERIIQVQQHLARNGFRTGGNPPYGFARYLVGPDGQIVEELQPGKRVRQAGHHVRILPKDEEKIAVWLYLLELKYDGWGIKRIAQHLNQLGIPSPNAGKTRTDNGAKHKVSGKWSASSVRELCRNKAILGMQVFGRRSEGRHRRLDENGYRFLEDSDWRTDVKTGESKPKMVFNDPSLHITAKAGFASRYDEEKWQEIQDKMDGRGNKQQGSRRVKDLSKYPLASKVFDMTENCGSPMYATTVPNRPVYKCGRYNRTAGAECHHNTVDAEALLRFTLRTMTQLAERHGGREKVRQLLLDRASRSEAPTVSIAQVARQGLQNQIVELEADLATAERRMAKEKDDELYDSLRQQVLNIRSEIKATKDRKAALPSDKPTPRNGTPEKEVEAAMALFDQLKRVANDKDARIAIPPLLDRLGVRIGLNFAAAVIKKRKTRKLVGGVIAFGGEELPVPIHGKDNCESKCTGDGAKRGCTEEERSATVQSEEITKRVRDGKTAKGSARGRKSKKDPQAKLSVDPVAVPSVNKRERKDVARKGAKNDSPPESLTKDSRGDRIRTCDFLLPKQAR